MTKTIAVDFDGVIHAYSRGWYDGSIYDEPMVGALEALEHFHDQGYEVVIFSARAGLVGGFDQIKEWMDRNGFEYGKHYQGITHTKIPARIYLDDRGLRFTNWMDSVLDIDTLMGAKHEG